MMITETYESDDMIAMQRYLRAQERKLVRAIPSKDGASMTIMHVPITPEPAAPKPRNPRFVATRK